MSAHRHSTRTAVKSRPAYYDDTNDVSDVYSSESESHESPMMRATQHQDEAMAIMDVLAMQQQTGVMLRHCDSQIQPHDPPNQWHFWRAYAAFMSGDSNAALRDLSLLKGSHFALPVTALSIHIHSNEKKKDKDLLQNLKTTLKVASKQHSTAESVLMAARYFLFVGKLAKARQCITRSLKQQRDREELLNLFALMDLRSASPSSSASSSSESIDPEACRERSRKVIRKAIKIAKLSALSASRSMPRPPLNSALIVSYYARFQQLEYVGELPKAIREIDHLSRSFPNCISAWEWKAKLLAATLEWKQCEQFCLEKLAVLQKNGKASTVHRELFPSPTSHVNSTSGSSCSETDSVTLRWMLALHTLLTCGAIVKPSAGYSRLSQFTQTLLTVEGRNASLLFEYARMLIALSRGEADVLDLSWTLLEKAMYVHRKMFPSSNHNEMARMLLLQGEMQLMLQDPHEANETFIEAFVMDESAAEPTLGQVIALLQLERMGETKKLLDTLPQSADIHSSESFLYPPSSSAVLLSSAQQSLQCMGRNFRLSYARAAYAWNHSADMEAAVEHLVEAVELHKELIYEMTHTSLPPSSSNSMNSPSSRSSDRDEILPRRAWNNALDAEYYPTYGGQYLLFMAELFLDIRGDRWKDPSNAREEENPEPLFADQLLQPLLAVLAHLSTVTPADDAVLLLLAKLCYIARDYHSCRRYLHRCSVLHGSRESALLALTSNSSPRVSGGVEKPSKSKYETRNLDISQKVSRDIKELASLLKLVGENHNRSNLPSEEGLEGRDLEELMKPRSKRKGYSRTQAKCASPTSRGKRSNESNKLFISTTFAAASSHAKKQPATNGNDSGDDDDTMNDAGERLMSSLGLDDTFSDPEDDDDDDRSRFEGGEDEDQESRRRRLQAELEASAEEALAEIEARASAASKGVEERSKAKAREAIERERAEKARQEDILARAEEEAREALDSWKKRSHRTSRDKLRESSVKGDSDSMAHSSSGSSLNNGGMHSRNSSAASLHTPTVVVPSYLSHFAHTGSSSSAHPPSTPSFAPALHTSHSDKTIGQTKSSPPSHPGSAAAASGYHPHHMANSNSMSSLDYSNLVRASPSGTPGGSPLATTFDLTAAAFYHSGHHSREGSLASTANSSGASSHASLPRPPRSLESTLMMVKKTSSSHLTSQVAQAQQFATVAAHGAVFWKHGRSGDPHQRTVKLTCSCSLDRQSGGNSSNHCDELVFDWHSGKMSIPRERFKLLQGKSSEVFRRSTASRSKSDLCFTIVGTNRTLDLEASSAEQQKQWVEGLLNLVQYFPCTTTTTITTENSISIDDNFSAININASPARHKKQASDSSVEGSSNSFFGVRTGPPLATSPQRK